MSLGLCGAPRTGKSILAEALASRTSRQFIPTNVSAVFEEFGIDPVAQIDFQTRLRIQNQLLDSCAGIWQAQKNPFVTDRTPIDLLAYTLADIQGATEVNFSEFEEYMRRCFEVTNRVFDVLIVLQPSIPPVSVRKAALNRAYIEHLNTIILGLCNDEKLECGVMYIRRDMTDLGERVQKILSVK
jgi:AAA domain